MTTDAFIGKVASTLSQPSDATRPMRIGSRLPAHLALAPACRSPGGDCGSMGWTIWISFTNSRMLPSSVFVGVRQYSSLMANERWQVSVGNIAIFGCLFILATLVLGSCSRP